MYSSNKSLCGTLSNPFPTTLNDISFEWPFLKCAPKICQKMLEKENDIDKRGFKGLLC